jgi:hypothetical protein
MRGGGRGGRASWESAPDAAVENWLEVSERGVGDAGVGLDGVERCGGRRAERKIGVT